MHTYTKLHLETICSDIQYNLSTLLPHSEPFEFANLIIVLGKGMCLRCESLMKTCRPPSLDGL